MTIRKYSSRSQQTTLTAPITSTATSMTVASGATVMGGRTVTSTQTFTVVIDPDTALEEIVDISNYSSGNTFTITRGVESGGTGIAHSAGAVVRHMITGRDLTEANDHINDDVDPHGLIIADVITTTNAKTLTNKTLTSPTITGTGAIAGTFTGNLTGNVTGNVSGTAGSTTGNAGTATALQTGRNFQLTGDVEASAVSFNGTGDVTLTTVIGTGAIVNADINASAAIDKTKISGTAITAADTGTVTSGMIADGTIVNADINASAGIAYGKLSLGGTITSADLVDGTIVNSDINASAGIALSKLATDPLARANHTGTQTASTISNFDTQVRTSRLDQMAAPTASVALNAQKITGLADPTNAQDAVTLNYITTQKGAANGLAELDGSGLVPTHHLPALAITTTQVVNSQAAMLALTAQTGDVAVRTDVNKSFILTATPASTLGNWQELLTPTDSVLSVDGSTGAVSLSGTYLNRTSGQLLGNLDANNFKVTGLGTPTSNADAATKAYVDTVAGSATAAAASAAAAATTYDNFDDRYLGSKSSAPTLDNDGNALIEGALYWNSVDNAMYAWTGTEWGSISSTAAIYRYRFNATGGETSVSGTDANGLTLSYLPGKAQVYLNGILLIPTTDYTASNGTSITSLAALSSGDVLEVITFTSFELASAIEETIFDAKGDLLVGTAADTVGKLTVGTNGQFLKADSSTATGLAWGEVAGALAQPSEPASPSDGQIWIDTDGTVTTAATLTRWYKVPTSGTTVLSGTGDNSVTLAYTAGYEQVYLNGTLLVRGSDYTATDGATVTLTTATVTGDTVEVIGTAVIGITDVYTQAQADNKYVPKNLTTTTGDIIYASSANTPARLGIGSTDQVLTVSGGVPAWATPSSGGMTLINETVASALSSLSFSSIPSTYKDLYLEWSGIDHSNALTKFEIRFNNDSASNYSARVIEFTDGAISTTNHLGTVASYWPAFGNAVNNGSTGSAHQVNGRLKISNYASAKKKTYEISYAFYDNQNGRYNGQAWMPNFYNSTSAITSIDIVRTAGAGTFSNQANTSIRLYGIS